MHLLYACYCSLQQVGFREVFPTKTTTTSVKTFLLVKELPLVVDMYSEN